MGRINWPAVPILRDVVIRHCHNYENDYIGQQITKLHADTYSDASVILHLDSDQVFVAPCDLQINCSRPANSEWSVILANAGPRQTVGVGAPPCSRGGPCRSTSQARLPSPFRVICIPRSVDSASRHMACRFRITRRRCGPIDSPNLPSCAVMRF